MTMTSEISFPIFCANCGATGKVAKITPGLQCRCGSTDLGLIGVDDGTVKTGARMQVLKLQHSNYRCVVDGEPATHHVRSISEMGNGVRDIGPVCEEHAQQAQEKGRIGSLHEAAPHGRGTGWTGPDPRRLDGWNEYPGPGPQTYPRDPSVAPDTSRCPTCHGTGYDLIDKGACRECGGTGVVTHPTQGPNPQFGESLDPGRPLPGGGAHWANAAYGNPYSTSSASNVTVTFTPEGEDLMRRLATAKWPDTLGDGESTTWWNHKITHNTETPLGDNNQPARGYLASTFTVEHPVGHPRTGATHEFFRSSPYKKGAPTPPQKSYAADQAHDAARNCIRCGPHTRQAGLSSEAAARLSGRAGPVQQLINQTTPGFGERGQRGPAHQQFDPEDAESFYPRADTRSPNLKNWQPGQAPEGSYKMDAASCPSCGTRPTELVKDKDEEAWWHCPNCGPLANIDAHPEINPYAPPHGFTPDRSMKRSGFMRRNRKTGRLMTVLSTIHEHNELGGSEAVSLARETLLRYPER